MGNLFSTRKVSYSAVPLISNTKDIKEDAIEDAEEDNSIRILTLYPPPWHLRWLHLLLHFIALYPPPWYFNWLPSILQLLIPLHGSLTVVRLSSKPKYKALSYTWGTDSPSTSIYISGSELSITPTLALALHHLRPRSHTLDIWIDQICINQTPGEENTEKSAQVEIMDQIYSSADEVLVWLGPAADSSNKLMSIFIRMSGFAQDFDLLGYYTKERLQLLTKIISREDPEDEATKKYHAFCDKMVPFFKTEVFEALAVLYKRRWFQRAWVFQEFALAEKATFICGAKRIDADHLMVILNTIEHTIASKILAISTSDGEMNKALEVNSTLNTMQPFFASRRRRQHGYKEEMYDILRRVHVGNNMQATQGCDMVYGLKALAADWKELGIGINYEGEEGEAKNVYTRTARAILRTGKIDLLVCVQHIKKDISLPSWVPDWRSEIRRSFAWLREEKSRKALFKASNELEAIVSVDTSGRVLQLRGFKVDTVEQVGGPWTGSDSESLSSFPHEAYINILTQIRLFCQLSAARNKGIYSSEERRKEAEWRIPVGDIEQDDTAQALRATPSWEKAYRQCWAELELQMQWKGFESLEEYRTKAKEVQESEDKEKSSPYRIRMQEMKGKSPFFTREGYVGMGPMCMKDGDEVVVLRGATVPFVVRGKGEGRYRLLGECYCDGIMDGEIVGVREEEDIILV